MESMLEVMSEKDRQLIIESVIDAVVLAEVDGKCRCTADHLRCFHYTCDGEVITRDQFVSEVMSNLQAFADDDREKEQDEIRQTRSALGM